ncbi:MAG TPA: hypothetical protein ENN35_08475 [Deltaproteobacteria bacterium]|nr:hypothetical protein [Deltaproteobacteria bacterium]
MDSQIIILLCIGIMVVIVLVSRLRGGHYGRLRPGSAPLESDAAAHVDPGKNYYTSGSEDYPNALMGLDKEWFLESDSWNKRNLTDSEIQELLSDMRHRGMEHMLFFQWFDILDHRRWKIGEWYGVQGTHITIKILGEKRVSITTPPLDTYSGT